MKLNIRYSTNKKKRHSNGMFSYVERHAELSPVRIIRSPRGSGAASNRYYYRAEFVAPEDAVFAFDGVITENISRKLNPHFKPRQFQWIGNVAELALEEA